MKEARMFQVMLGIVLVFIVVLAALYMFSTYHSRVEHSECSKLCGGHVESFKYEVCLCAGRTP